MRLIRLLKNDLANETADWVQKGLITPIQARNICNQYGIDYDNPSRHSYGYFILVTLGYLFVGLACITLIGANWESIPRAVRMIGLIAITTGINLMGLYKYKSSNPSGAIGLFFLGSIFYGATIMLIAQIYHIGEHYPDGIFWWAMGVLPLALLLESTLLMILTSILGFTWFFTQASLNYFPVLFPAFLAAMAWHILKNKQSNLIFLALVAGSGMFLEYCLSWAIGSPHRFSLEIENLFLGFGIFIFFHGLSKWLNTRPEHAMKDYAALLSAWTLRFFILSLLFLSFEDPWQDIITANWQAPMLIGAVNLCFCLISIGLSYRADQTPMTSVLFTTLLFALFFVLTALNLDKQSLYLVVADNLLLIISGIWLIIQGIRSSISHYFFLGVITILLTGLFRYVDLVGDYIGASILFAVFAVILLTTAKFWKHHHSKKGEGHVQ